MALAADSRLPEGRVHALYALAGLQRLDERTLLDALTDDHPRVRQHAVRLSERIAPQSPAVRREMLQRVGDPDLLVRFQTAFSLGTFAGEDRDAALAHLIREDGADSWFRLAVLSAVGHRQGEMFRRLVTDKEVRRSKPGREVLVELASQIGAKGSPAAVDSLASAVDTLPADERSLAESLVQSVVVAASSLSVVETIQGHGGRSADLMSQLLSTAKQRALDSDQRDSSRVSAIRLLRLLPFEQVEPIVRQLLELQQSPAVQQAAVDLVGTATGPRAASLLLQKWAELTPQRRAQVFEVLSLRGEWLAQLMDEVEADRISRADLDPARLQILTTHPSSEIRERAQRLFAHNRANAIRERVVADYQHALTLSGDPAAGKGHFQRVCSACHRLEQVGTAVGADLKAIRNRGMPAILLNVLDPNREVKPQYLTYVVVTTDGRVHTGMIQSESANSLTLRRPDHSSVTILRVDIEEMRSSGLSFMPEGLEKQLDQQAMADLLAYLNSIE
jgi:putative heme-binding domain-containing protein